MGPFCAPITTARAALIQHDNLLDVQNFVVQDGLRVMEMEWVDGYDLREVLTQALLDRTRQRVSPERWDYVNRVIITAGPAQPRLKPGVAIQVLRARRPRPASGRSGCG